MNNGKIHDYGSSVTASIDKLIQLNQFFSKHFIIAFRQSVVLLISLYYSIVSIRNSVHVKKMHLPYNKQ